jgi:EAL domain-containing protein (putative c-di-GMP-specific phosphodiesterase class I)
MGVNVSGRQLAEPGFIPMLEAILRATGLDPRALRLEVREHDLSRDSETTRRTLSHVLHTLGVRWQIDDFGTGASSLRLLHRFPGDAVKIFGPLVSGMGHDGGSFEIVKAIVELAHNLGLEVVAEGVETAGQLEHLRVLGCEFAQGFHVSAPLAARDARALLAQGALVR